MLNRQRETLSSLRFIRKSQKSPTEGHNRRRIRDEREEGTISHPTEEEIIDNESI